jgi:hypothetical protein
LDSVLNLKKEATRGQRQLLYLDIGKGIEKLALIACNDHNVGALRGQLACNSES